MNPETLTTVVNLGSAGAVIMTVSLFLLHLRKCQAADRAEREAERKSLTDLISNDLRHVGDGLANVNASLSKVNAALDVNTQVLRELKECKP